MASKPRTLSGSVTRATSVVRSYALPNGGKIVSLRPETFRSALGAASSAMKKERSAAAGKREHAKRA